MSEHEENLSVDAGIPIEQMLLIVTGAHLRGERMDRPLAYQLADAVRTWVHHQPERLGLQLEPVVCSDIWYVNDAELQMRPTISIGGPGVNALTAYFAQHLSPATMGTDQVVLQMDPEWVDLRVAVWGMDHDSTCDAVDVFEQRHLSDYLRAVVTQVEPLVD